MNVKGIAAISSAKKPSNELAQLTPRLLYIGLTASGNPNAASDRVVLAAACAEADAVSKKSVM